MYRYTQQARKVLCIGRNYVDHIKELNNKAPKQPFFFLKPTSSIVTENNPILVPQGTTVHYEMELALILGKELKNLDLASFNNQQALDAIDGYALALDLTARNVQDEAKKKGLPWSIGKGFDTFLPMSKYISKSQLSDPHNALIDCHVNGSTKQHDSTNLMIFQIPQILSTMSAVMTLEPGDIILTGTPKGVGPIVPGDKIGGSLSFNGKVIEESKMKFNVEEKPGPYFYKET